MAFPYDNPDQWRDGFPMGWNPQAVLMQALQMQNGAPPTMPQAIRGGVTGRASDSASSSTGSSFTPAGLTQAQQTLAGGGGGSAPPGPAYFGPTHQALSQALQGAVVQQAAMPGLLAQQMQHGNWPIWQERGGLWNNGTGGVGDLNYPMVDWGASNGAQAGPLRWSQGAPAPGSYSAQQAAAAQAAAAQQALIGPAPPPPPAPVAEPPPAIPGFTFGRDPFPSP